MARSDGSIRIAVEVDGKQIKTTSKELDKLESSGKKSGQGLKNAEQSMKGVENSSNKATSSIKKFVGAIGLIALGATVFNTLRSSMDAAIKRFDTLNTFPSVLQELGVSAEDSERAMKKLSDGIDGLPTTLDEIASTTQRMYTSFNDIDKATDTALALNNALLGSGSSAEDAKRGTEQYLQALQRGKFEMEEWKTLQETMDVGLIKIAESFGYTGKTAKQDLYDALKSGIITMDEFNDKLIEVGTGTGVMAKLAKKNSLGIATSLSNLRNAFARGIANILESLNRLSKEATGKDIAQNIDSLKVIVNAAFNAMGNVIEATAPIMKGFIAVLNGTFTAINTLKPAIIGATAAYAGFAIVNKVTGWIKATNTAVATATATQKALTLAKVADTAATSAQTGALTLSQLAIGVLTGKIKLATAATIAWTAAKKLLGGPIGWVTAGIGALTGAVVGIVKWFNRETEESKKLKSEMEKLSEATDGIKESTEQSSKAFEENQKNIQSTAKANENLIKRIEELSEKENKSASDKLLLAKYVDQLNQSVEGLNLSYDQNADSLSMSTEELQKRVGLMQEEENLIAAQERLLEIDKERNDVQLQLEEINKLREEWNKKLEEGTVKSKEHKDAIAELDEQDQELNETLSKLEEQQASTEEQIVSSTEAITEAVKSGVASQKLAYEDLTEAQQQVVDNLKTSFEDYKDAATNMFDTLSDKSELTVSEMTKNLEENQRIISEWADNIAILAERGVDEGLLETLRQAGPSSAGHVNALVNASDEELQRLNEVFTNGGQVATEALAKSLGIEESNILDALSNLVTDTDRTLREQIESANFEEHGVYIAEGAAKGIEKGTPEAERAVEHMAEGTQAAFRGAMEIHSPSGVFKDFGLNIAEGLAIGITQGSSKVIQAIQKMFVQVQKDSVANFKSITKSYDGAISQIEKTLAKLPQVTQKSMTNTNNVLTNGNRAQINIMQATSRFYQQYSQQLNAAFTKMTTTVQKAMQAMLNKMKSSAASQTSLMKKHSSNLVKSYNGLPSSLKNVGVQAMNGLNAGLNAGKGKVLSTARTIANQVSATMKKALEIHSPSRVMRDDVGKWIPLGLAEGIRDYSHIIKKEMEAMTNKMIIATPEMALGANRMVYSSGASVQNMNVKQSKTVTPNIEQVVNIEASDVIMDGQKVGKIVWKTVKSEVDRNNNRRRRYPRGGGAFA